MGGMGLNASKVHSIPRPADVQRKPRLTTQQELKTCPGASRSVAGRAHLDNVSHLTSGRVADQTKKASAEAEAQVANEDTTKW
jgi:hypothetical protein